MGKKKMNLLPAMAMFSSKNRAETGLPWRHWAAPCKHPKTLSFRAGDGSSPGDAPMFKTVNSVFFDPSPDGPGAGFNHSPEASWFTSTSESASHSTESEDQVDESLEVLVRGARSDRLFFEPKGYTSSIVGPVESSCVDALSSPFKESVALAMESENPYIDFRRSMEEMVESIGMEDWECLEELLGWYLRMNSKNNHGFIVEAFIDLLLNLTSSSSSNDQDGCGDCNKNADLTSFSSAASSFSDDSSDPSLKGEDDVAETEEQEKMIVSLS